MSLQLEQRVVRTVARVHRLPVAFWRQLDHLQVVRREMTGFGYFCHVTVDPRLAGSFAQSVYSLRASHPAVADGHSGALSFTVFMEHGLIALLEGACIEAWPESEALIRIEGE